MAKKKATKKKATKSAKTKTKTVKASGDKKPKPKTTRKGKSDVKVVAEPVVVLSHDAIAAKAYEIWLSKGRPDGQDETNWIEAEQALKD